MGLDIYAGTLTRYYSHNWKTVVQQWAEENGYAFNRITPDGEPADNEEELSPAEVQAAVENWRDQILNAISQPGQPPYAPCCTQESGVKYHSRISSGEIG